MDATTIGAAIACVGVLSGSVVAWLGKRGENALLLVDQVQEERDRLEMQLTAAQARIISLQEQRNSDLLEITRLQVKIIQLGGEPL